MKHVKLFEQFVNEASDRVPTHLYPSDFDKYFSTYYIDLKQVYMTNTSPRIVMADNGKYYEISSVTNRWGDRVIKTKSVKAPK